MISLNVNEKEELENILRWVIDSGRAGISEDQEFIFEDIINKINATDSDNYISIVWTIEEVLEVRPDLTAGQAMEVLGRAEDNHDCNKGITWDTLEFWANELFGAFKGNRQISFKRFPKAWIGNIRDITPA